jgi:hypothetical protein
VGFDFIVFYSNLFAHGFSFGLCGWLGNADEGGVGNRGLVIWGSPMLLGDWEGVKCDGMHSIQINRCKNAMKPKNAMGGREVRSSSPCEERFAKMKEKTRSASMKTNLMDDKSERAGRKFLLSRALPRSTGTPASTAGGPAFCRVVLTWPFWYTLPRPPGRAAVSQLRLGVRDKGGGPTLYNPMPASTTLSLVGVESHAALRSLRWIVHYC